MKISDQDYQRIIDFLNNELDEQEENLFGEWLSKSDENRKAYEAIYRKMLLMRWSVQDQSVNAVDDMPEFKRKTVSRKRILTIVSIAASAVIILGLTFNFLFSTNESVEIETLEIAMIQPGELGAELILSNGQTLNIMNLSSSIVEKYISLIEMDSLQGLSYKSLAQSTNELVFNTLRVGRGYEFNILLSDGTRVWLNSDSELKYPIAFNGDKREVYLSGEAFFDVVGDEQKPFIVHAKGTKVEVLGTQFNVSCYAEQGYVATTLVEGSVDVKTENNHSVILPGEQASILTGSSEIKVNKVNTTIYTSWVNGVYEFENTQLEYIMAQLGRWYDVDIRFEREDVKNICFTGAIKKDKPFGFALDLIDRIADVEFKVVEDEIIISN